MKQQKKYISQLMKAIQNHFKKINPYYDGYVFDHENETAGEFQLGLYDDNFCLKISGRKNDIFVTIVRDNWSCISEAHEARAEQANEIALCYPLTEAPYQHVTIEIPNHKILKKIIKIHALYLEHDLRLILDGLRITENIFCDSPMFPVTQADKDFISKWNEKEFIPTPIDSEPEEPEEIPF